MEFSEQIKQHSQQYQELLKNIKNPKNIRILQRDLVYLVGIPQELADENILVRPEFLGQYGKIDKISVGNAYPKKKKQLQKFQSSHVKFANVEEACIAVLCLNGLQIDDYQLKASFGFSRYCHDFLSDKECQDKDCNYIHHWSNPEDCCSSSNKLFNKQLRAFEKEDIVNYLIKRNFDFKKLFETSATNQFSIFPNVANFQNLIERLTNLPPNKTDTCDSVYSTKNLSISSSEESQFDKNQKEKSAQKKLQNPAIRQIQMNSADCLNKKYVKQNNIKIDDSFGYNFNIQDKMHDDSISTYFSNNNTFKKKHQKQKLKRKSKFSEFVKENQKKTINLQNQTQCQNQYQTNLVHQHYSYQINPLQNYYYHQPHNGFAWQLCNTNCKCQINQRLNMLSLNDGCVFKSNMNQIFYSQC